MKILRMAAAAALAILAAVSCKSQYDALMSSTDPDLKYKAAFDYFNQGKYTKSAAIFESLSMITNGTMRDDTVQYYWGLSNYRFKDYYTAETNFEKFTTNFPRSPFAEEARFLRIDCLYRQTLRYELDQTPTYNCINVIGEYLKEFPLNDHLSDCSAMLSDLGARLDRKAYENAKLYFRMEDYQASRVAFRNVLKDDAENIFREDILYYIAKSSYKYASLSVQSKQKERYLVFMDDYLNFVSEIPESPYRKELDVLYAKSQKALGRYSGSDELVNQNTKEFDKERRAEDKALFRSERQNSGKKAKKSEDN